MKLPKLYRVVYLELDWVQDDCWDGEHHQSTGSVYPRARIVIKNGVKVWQIIDRDLALQALYEDEFESFLCDGHCNVKWLDHNPEAKEFNELIRHNPNYHN